MRPYCRAHETIRASADMRECDSGMVEGSGAGAEWERLAPVDLLPGTYMGMRALAVGLDAEDLPGWGTALDAEDLLALHA